MPTAFQTLVAELESGTHPPDPRTDVDTESLRARYPELADVTVTDLSLEGRHGAIPARLYRETVTPRAGFVWVHGGSWVGGNLDMPEANWPPLALAARGISVLSIDYRKALGVVHFPVPSDDVVDAWLWAFDHADRFGVAANQLRLGGASAGANLAAGAALRLRDGEGALPAGLVLVYPALHDELPDPSDELSQALVRSNRDLDADGVREMALNYAGSAEAAMNPYAFPPRGSAAGLPPVLILNSDYDLLRASGEAYANQIAAAGGRVTVRFEPDTPHGHLNQPHLPAAHTSIDTIVEWLLLSDDKDPA